jgi:outer membrane receptor protein involved in Fe transport
VTYVGRRFANDANTLTIPSYTVWDAGLRYSPSKVDTIQLAVKNLANRRYVEDAQSALSINQGTPRSVSLRYIRTF